MRSRVRRWFLLAYCHTLIFLLKSDLLLSRKAGCLLRWVSEWSGLSYRTLLRILVLTYASMVVAGLLWSQRLFGLMTVVPVLMTAYLLWKLTRFTVLRCVSLEAKAWFWGPSLILPAINHSILMVAGYAACLLFLHALGADEGEPGRRAKMAWSKVVALFGTSWIEKPVGSHA